MITRNPAKSVFATCLLAAVAIGMPAPVEANSWPQRSVRIIAPAAGSPADIAARLIGEALSKRWKQPVIIENRPGADNILAIRALLEARDGHTLLFVTHSALTVNPLLHAKLPYDPVRDLAPISLVVDDFLGFVVTAALAPASLQELVSLAHGSPDALNVYTVPGSPYLSWLALQKRTGIKTTFVSYRTPSAAMADLSEGRIQAALVPLAFVRGPLDAGKARLLAVTNASRSPIAPDIVTVAEAGFPDLTFGGLLGLFGPSEMRMEVREQIASAVTEVLRMPGMVQKLEGAGLAPRGTSPAEFAKILDEQRAKWAQIAREHAIEPRQ